MISMRPFARSTTSPTSTIFSATACAMDVERVHRMERQRRSIPTLSALKKNASAWATTGMGYLFPSLIQSENRWHLTRPSLNMIQSTNDLPPGSRIVSKSRILFAAVFLLTILGLTRFFALGAQGTKKGGGKLKKQSATPIELIKVKKDFQVELLYSVPKATQGSWVSMTVDPKGRLITSDQYGKLYRITPPAIGGKADDTKVEELPVALGEAHGLLWAFDSLYVVVNEGRKYKPRGLWRVTSSKNDDVLDKKELLREIDGGGEHGPHAVLLGPDRKSLYVLHGNHTKPIKTNHTTVPPIWGEDFLVPRLWDASGHAVGIIAPAGCIYKTDKDGKEWTL